MFVEIALESTYPVLPKFGENSQLRIYNGRDCDYTIGVGNGIANFDLKSGAFHLETISVPSNTLSFTITATTTSSGCSGFTHSGVLESGKANSFYFEKNSIISFEDHPDKSRQGRPAVRVLTNFQSGRLVELHGKNADERYTFNSTQRADVLASDYSVLIDGNSFGSGYSLKLGGVYTFIVTEKATYNNYVGYEFKIITVY